MRISEDAGTTLFSFGYWGAGSATPALVQAVNEAEALRGFEPPLWADIRISRSVRAVGFQDHAFEKLLGSQYVWMSDLGNLRILEDGEGRIKIKNPAAAETLLEHALSAPKRRVIFFCSCEVPDGCHRQAVGKLVKKAAKRRGLDVTVVEWPGGEPDSISLDVSPAVLRAVARDGKKSIDVPRDMTIGTAASLPWGTRAELKAGTETFSVLLGPARFNQSGAHLKVLDEEIDADLFRRESGYDALA